MSEDGITPEEVAALTTTETAPAPAGVRPRDFRQPMRLSSEQLSELRVGVSLELKEIASAFKPWFRSEQALTLETLSEVSFQDLPTSVEGSICAMIFRVRESVGWVLWNTTAALAATARAMGVEPQEDDEEPNEQETPAAEKLSPVEASIACKFLGQALNQLCALFELQAHDFHILQSHEELEHSVAQLRGQDSQRLRIDLTIDGPGEPSTLKFYLPGVVPPAEPTRPSAGSAKVSLPAHLTKVDLALSAEFDPVDLALDDLLALEAGDVIPLTTRIGDPINLTIEELGCAKVKLGKKDGQLAVKLESLTLGSIQEGKSPKS